MADSRHITRRSAIVGLAVTAATVGAVAAETPTTEPAKSDLQGWLESQNARTRANYHMTELTRALNEMNPGTWVASVKAGLEVDLLHDYVLIHRAPDGDARPGIWVQHL